ncbi:MAG TPA: hypothetical protein DIC64_04930 [Alphaproteobacteria bacterium]|nr:hypothetical protein [Alphaproteobacteria bacterium]
MIRSALYEKALKLLQKEFADNFKIVVGSQFHEAYIKEKIRHSMQVAGAGNGILAHEEYFLRQSEDFVETARIAILLHDIYRFREVRGWFETGAKIDHGEKGAELLSQTKDFNNILITLPIKHHGHMIERMYEDKTYKALDEATKDEVKHIAFAVRDADKIANWNLLKNEWSKMKSVWLPNPDDFSQSQTKINDELWDWFVREEVAPNTLRKTNADAAISIICWLFDMNYEYSISYCKKLGLFENWSVILSELGVEKQKIETVKKTMKNYLLKTFNVEF